MYKLTIPILVLLIQAFMATAIVPWDFYHGAWTLIVGGFAIALTYQVMTRKHES